MDTPATPRPTDAPSTPDTDPTHLARLRGVLADDRGQANLIGMVFVIVILLGMLTFAQTHIAPQIRQETEIKHASTVTTDFQGIHGDTISATTTGQRASTVLHMGREYPSSVFLIHPPDPAGRLSTTDPKTIELANVQATNGETADFLDGSTQQYDHQPVRYTPNYNQFRSAGVSVLELGTYYQDFDDTGVDVISDPHLVEGNTIRLAATHGDMATGSSDGKLFQTRPLSASEQTVIVEDTGSRPEIRIETSLDAGTWRELLADEVDENPSPLNDRYIVNIKDGGGDVVVIVLEQDATYEVNTAKLHHKTADQPRAAKSEVPAVAYLTTAQATETTVPADGTKQFTLEVRDRFNNPLPNEAIEATTSHPDSSVDAVTRVSRTDGTVTLIYHAPSSAATPPDQDTLTVLLTTADSLPPDQRTVEFTINIED